MASEANKIKCIRSKKCPCGHFQVRNGFQMVLNRINELGKTFQRYLVEQRLENQQDFEAVLNENQIKPFENDNTIRVGFK